MSVEIHLNVIKVSSRFRKVINDPKVTLAMHNTFAKEMNPYVPMQTGVLSQSIEITPDYVRYTQPYAHYQYTGIVYGPNFPITENGVITGWFSPPGRGSKHPTGELIEYSTEMHPLATHHWDKAMLRDKGKEFKKQIKDILVYYLNRSK